MAPLKSSNDVLPLSPFFLHTMMSHRFFCNQISNSHATLDGQEAHHLMHVMRNKVGDEVVLFDGSGHEYEANVINIGRSSVDLRVGPPMDVNRELKRPLWIASALPKGDRQIWMIQKLVELGVSNFIPLITGRGVAKLTMAAMSRLEKQVIEASKQCRRNVLMEIAQPIDLQRLPAQIPVEVQCAIADPSGDSIESIRNKNVCFVVGPEGGFTDDELEFGRTAGWTIVNLGPRILRIETAATAVAAWHAFESMS